MAKRDEMGVPIPRPQKDEYQVGMRLKDPERKLMEEVRMRLQDTYGVSFDNKSLFLHALKRLHALLTEGQGGVPARPTMPSGEASEPLPPPPPAEIPPARPPSRRSKKKAD